MATATKALPPIPAPHAPLVNPNTGLINPVWYRFLKEHESVIRPALGISVTGWGTPTGTETRTTFDTTTVTTEQLAQRVFALIEDLRARGLLSS
jgi:hypothetical protein